MKTIDTLVSDIYTMLEDGQLAEGCDMETICEDFGREASALLKDSLSRYDATGKLRLSAIGKPDRKIFNAFAGIEGTPLKGPTYVKFLYGHLIEAMVLALAKLAGHSVSDQQKEVSVLGVKGHIDGRIDGQLMDVKSASDYGFKKFRKGTLHEDDAFGYIEQLKAYAHAEGDTQYSWVAVNKVTGEICVLSYDEKDTNSPYHDKINYNIEERVAEVKKLVGGTLVPTECYSPVPDGLSGNIKLQSGCGWCEFRKHCWPEAKAYRYANGTRYLVHVEREPKVSDVPEGF